MIAILDPASRPELNDDELKQLILPPFFVFFQTFAEIENVLKWEDGTLEIEYNGTSGGSDVTDVMYYSKGLFYTKTTKNFPAVTGTRKKIILVCSGPEGDSLCIKGCGCRCMIDRGYMNPPVDPPTSAAEHCKE